MNIAKSFCSYCGGRRNRIGLGFILAPLLLSLHSRLLVAQVYDPTPLGLATTGENGGLNLNVTGYDAFASTPITNPSPSDNASTQLVGYGSEIGTAYGAVFGVNPDQSGYQWVLTNDGANSGSGLIRTEVGTNAQEELDDAKVPVTFSDLSPNLTSFWGVGEPVLASYPSYANLVAASTPITTLDVPGFSTMYVDVTGYVNSLPVQPDGYTSYFDAGFAMSVPGNLDDDKGGWAAFSGLFLQWRDGSINLPYVPTGVNGGTTNFGGQGNGWYDPALASGFQYVASGSTLFTQIADFPSGFGPFTVSVGGVVLGTYTAGQSVDFSSFPGGGVSSFSITGISPSVDSTNVLSFPLDLAFNQSNATFDMIATPEPSSVVLLGFGAIGLGAMALRRRMRKQSV